jgi:hypothetical protein
LREAIIRAFSSCARKFLESPSSARALLGDSAGIKNAKTIPTIPTTTNISINVKAARRILRISWNFVHG